MKFKHWLFILRGTALAILIALGLAGWALEGLTMALGG